MPSLAFRKASICSRLSFSASCTLVVNPQHATHSRLILYWKRGCATSKWRSSGAACLPVVLKAVVKLTTSEGDDSVSASDGPEHAGLFEASTDYGFAPGFDNAGADKEMLAAELWVAHAGCILGKVVRLDTELLDDFRVGGGDGAQGENQLFDFSLVK